MSCPDWPSLVERRDDGRLGESGWTRELVHLDTCDACRGEALAADPLLVFRSLPDEDGVSDSDVASVRHAVRALRSAGAVVRPTRRLHLWRAAAALLLVSLAGLAPGDPFDPPVAGDGPSSSRALPAALEGVDTAAIPLVEELDRPGARVYQLREDDLSVVMIVDESLDV